MVCSNYSFNSDEPFVDNMTYSNDCDDESTYYGNMQFDFILKTVQEWQADKNMLWKATVLHYNMWSANKHDDTNEII